MARINLNKRQRETLLKGIWDDYEWGRSERREHESAWREARAQFNAEWVELRKLEDDEDLDQWINVPKTKMTVLRMLAALLQHFYPQRRKKLAKVVPPHPTSSPGATIADKVLHAKLDMEARPEGALYFQWESALVEGDGWLKAMWTDRPVIQYVENEALVRDPYAKCVEDTAWVIHEIYLTGEELWQRQQDGVYENVEEVTAGGDEAREDEWRISLSAPSKRARFLYKILEFWGPAQFLDDDQLSKMHKRGRHEPAQNIVATVYKNKAVLRVEDNPYARLLDDPKPFEKLPFFKATATPSRRDRNGNGTTYGQGIPEHIKALQREINTMRNQRRLAVEGELSPKILFDRNRLTDLPALFRGRYGGPVPVDGDPRTVAQVFTVATSTGQMAQEEQLMVGDLRDLTGVTPYHMGGVEPGMQKTATGTSMVMGEGNVKLDTLIDHIALSSILPLARFVLQCCAEWMTNEEVEQIIGAVENPLPFAFRDIVTRDFQVEVEAGASATSKQLQIGNNERTMASLAQVANALPEPAFAAMSVILPQHLLLLGNAEGAAKFQETMEQMQGAQAPAGSQQTGPGNPENQRAQQGQRPNLSVQETVGV